MVQMQQIRKREKQTSSQHQEREKDRDVKEICNERWLNEGEFTSIVPNPQLPY